MDYTDKDGSYCSTCGGIRPDKITTKRIIVDGKDIGINRLEDIIKEVRSLGLVDDQAITEQLLNRTRAVNYVPTSRARAYGDALLAEYKKGE